MQHIINCVLVPAVVKRRLPRGRYGFAKLGLAFLPALLAASDGAYFVTYSHQMEEPGNLEIAVNAVTARPMGGFRFLNQLTELEYGATGWWTTEVYLSGQKTSHESALFTGFRWENRYRP